MCKAILLKDGVVVKDLTSLAILQEYRRIWAKEEAVRRGRKVRASSGAYSPAKAPSDGGSPERDVEHFEQDQYLTAFRGDSPGKPRPEVFLQGEARWISKDGDIITTSTVGGKRVPRALPEEDQPTPALPEEHLCSMGAACSVG